MSRVLPSSEGEAREKEDGHPNNPTNLIPEIISSLDEKTPSHQILSAFYSGPIPLPRLLKGYDDIVPGAAQQILSNAMDQAQHRRRLESLTIEGNERRSDRGLYIGGGLAVCCLAAGTFLGSSGQPWLAGTLFTTTIGSILGSFLYAHHQRQAEVEGKSKLKEELVGKRPTPAEPPTSPEPPM